MDKHELQKRLKQFAYRCVKMSEFLPKSVLGKYFTNQLIRAAFSAAANYRAACIAQSKPAFVAKLSIAFEEIDESSFWLENISDLELIKKDRLEALHKEAVEL